MTAGDKQHVWHTPDVAIGSTGGGLAATFTPVSYWQAGHHAVTTGAWKGRNDGRRWPDFHGYPLLHLGVLRFAD
jgi:hypothetical protein